jgi:hypothetical protein
MEKNWVVFSFNKSRTNVEKVHYANLSLEEALKIVENSGQSLSYSKSNLLDTDSRLIYNNYYYA